MPAVAASVGSSAGDSLPHLWVLQRTSTMAAFGPASAMIWWARCSSDPTCDSRSWAAWAPALTPFRVESVPQNPTIHDTEIRRSAAVRSPTLRTRDSVSFSEPSLFPLTMKAVAPPLRAFLRNPRPSESSMCSAA
jgi:hypothetical protein